MMKFLTNTLCLVSILLIASGTHRLMAQNTERYEINLNSGWEYYPAWNVNRGIIKTKVNVPHTWNVDDVFGKINYSRETMIYQRPLMIADEMKGKRLFLKFEGVNSVANVLINKQFVGEHIGGYTAFCYEITDFVDYGKENVIDVYASNSYRLDVIPLSGDFNIYGGIHRPVSLIVTESNCISPLDYASTGVYIKPKKVSEQSVEVDVVTMLSLTQMKSGLKLRTTIQDKKNKTVAQSISDVSVDESGEFSQILSFNNPILWNGKQNPYLYNVKVELLDNEKVIDVVNEKTGFRYFSVNPDKGFFLNGKYLDLYGFGKHEDKQGKGSALVYEDYLRDMDLINQSGATSLRLTHYPHGKPIYDLSDENGIILWTEIPFVGPGGYTGPGYIKIPNLEENAKTMMIELIKQKYNHPSVCFWGTFNELRLDYGDPLSFAKELNELIKKEDPSRLTALATFINQEHFLEAADLVAWNKYYGWYEGSPRDIGTFADEARSTSEDTPIGISEYGAGGSINHHQFPAVKPVATGRFHPEEWQTIYHEQNWEELSKRPFVWSKYIWNFADFSSSIRTEGDRDGVNDKGLITYDHKTKKDAFYFYKANWNPEPMIYISSRRFILRDNPMTEVKIFTNAKDAELSVNGVKMGKKPKDAMNRIIWSDIQLSKGKNKIEVTSKVGNKILTDECEWILQ